MTLAMLNVCNFGMFRVLQVTGLITEQNKGNRRLNTRASPRGAPENSPQLVVGRVNPKNRLVLNAASRCTARAGEVAHGPKGAA